MIHWLIANDYPSHDMWLSDWEKAHQSTLKTPKRRHEWRLGRWGMKCLIQHMSANAPRQASAISIERGSDGAPFVRALPLSISISHSHDKAVCAAIAQPDLPLGIDIEHIAPRSAGFVADFFTQSEQTRLRSIAPQHHALLVNAIWSAKEAVLKALHLGLTVDTRSLTCHIKTTEASETWQRFGIEWHRQHPSPIPQLGGWWRVIDQDVLTLVAPQGFGVQPSLQIGGIEQHG